MSTAKPPLRTVSHGDEQCAREDPHQRLCDLCDRPFDLLETRLSVRVNAHAPAVIVVHVECCEIVSRYAAILLH